MLDNLPAEWKREWQAEARIEGEAYSLVRLLERRFGTVPDTVRRRIAEADLPRLREWFDRAVDAPGIDEVLH